MKRFYTYILSMALFVGVSQLLSAETESCKDIVDDFSLIETTKKSEEIKLMIANDQTAALISFLDANNICPTTKIQQDVNTRKVVNILEQTITSSNDSKGFMALNKYYQLDVSFSGAASLLDMAANYKKLPIFKALIALGVDVNEFVHDEHLLERRSLYMNEDASYVKSVTDAGADLSLFEKSHAKQDSSLAYEVARRAKNPMVLRYLIDAGIDPLYKGDARLPVLAAAALNNSYAMFEMLVSQGADLEGFASAIFSSSNLPTFYFDFSQRLQMLKLLVDENVDLNATGVYTTNDGYRTEQVTPLHAIARLKEFPAGGTQNASDLLEIVDLLIDNNSKATLDDNSLMPYQVLEKRVREFDVNNDQLVQLIIQKLDF